MSLPYPCRYPILTPGWVKNDLWRKARAIPSLDLRFADNKSLVDATTGQNLVSFTRASSGTYVDSQGVIRTATTNLLLRSEEFDNASWTKSGATITSNATTAPNGAITADALVEDTSTGAHNILQSASLVASSIYTFSVYAKAIDTTRDLRLFVPTGIFGSGNATFNLQAVTASPAGAVTSASITPLANGWYRCTAISLQAGSTGNGNFTMQLLSAGNATYTGNGASGIYLWGAQLEQSSTVGEYIPTTSTINSAPRFDHNPTTGESLGLLVEESRTNLCTYSEAFDDASWIKISLNGTITANQTTAPDGLNTADLYQEDANTLGRFVGKSLSATSGTTYTAVFWAKQAPGSTRYAGIVLPAVSFGVNVIASYTLSGAGSVTIAASGTGTSASIQQFPNGWYRCSLTSQATVTISGNIQFRLSNSAANGAATYAGDGSSGLYIWGAQIEVGAFPTSYIPTTTATVTRSADVASISGSNFGVSRTNLLLRSEEFGDASWTKTAASVSANSIAAPNGTVTADSLIEDGTNASHIAFQAVSAVSGLAYTASIYAKKGTRSWAQIAFQSTAFGLNAWANFDLNLGAVGFVGTSATATIQSIGDGWYRCSVTATASATSATGGCAISILNQNTNSRLPSHQGDGTSGIYLWGAQQETGTTATAYIPTPGVFVSRASSGTYIGGDGVLRSATTNLLLQSEDFSTTWANTGSTENINVIAAPNGSTTADALVDTTVSEVHAFTQSIAGVVGNTSYTFSCFMKKGSKNFGYLSFTPNGSWGVGTGANVFFDLASGTVGASSNATGSIQIFPNGWYRCVATATTVASPGTVTLRVGASLNGTSQTYAGSADEAIYLWGAQLEQSSSVGEYIPTTSTVNSAARYDHDPVTLIGKGLLLEEARTNSIRNNTMIGAVAGTPGTLPTNWGTAGGTGLTRTVVGTGTENGINYIDVNFAGTTGTSFTSLIFDSGLTGLTTATSYCLSTYVKLVGGSFANTTARALYLRYNLSPSGSTDISTAITVPTSGSLIDSRVQLVGTTAGTMAGGGIVFLLVNHASGVAVDFTLRIGMPQLEQGAYATSVIPTFNTTATRAADVSTSSAVTVFSSPWYRQDEGTVFVDAAAPASVSNVGFVGLNSAGSTNRAEIRQQRYNPTLTGASVSATFVEVTAGPAILANTFYKQAFAFSNSSHASAVSYGLQVSTTSIGTVAATQLVFGMRDGQTAPTGGASCTFKRLTVFPQRLSNSTLSAITQ